MNATLESTDLFSLDTLNSIAKQIKAGDNGNWSDAALTMSWSVGPAGGNLQGWITYYDETKIHISGSVTGKVGTGAGAVAIPYIRFKDFKDMPASGKFDVSGFSVLGATIHLKDDSGESLCMPASISSSSAAPWDFRLSGTIKYSK